MTKSVNLTWAQNAGDGDYAALYLDDKLHFETWSGPCDPIDLLQRLEGYNIGSVSVVDTEHPFFDKEGNELDKPGWPPLLSDVSPVNEDSEEE